jgi:hypothetical protein
MDLLEVRDGLVVDQDLVALGDLACAAVTGAAASGSRFPCSPRRVA